MVNELLVTYGLYRIGSVLFFPLVIVGALLLFTPIGWLILAVLWFLGQAYKGVEEQLAEEDGKTGNADPQAPAAPSR